MVRSLLGDIEASSLVWIGPVASKDLTDNRIQGFLDASLLLLVEFH